MEREGLPQKLLLASSSNTNDQDKKIVRKEIERQRRLQMSTLLGSLRSLIPPQLIKGKRSTSDVLNEAVTHINHLRTNIQELSSKRDELKGLATDSSTGLENDHVGSSSGNSIYDTVWNSVSVRHYIGGIEIVITINECGGKSFLLSRVLQVVLEEGLDVTNCVLTNKDEAFCFANIQCQACDFTCVDLEGLRQKLTNVLLIDKMLS